MKFSKKFAAVFAAMVMCVTALTSAVPAYAKTSKNEITCASSTVYVKLTSKNKYNGKSKTYTSVTFSYLYAATFGTVVDKNGDTVKYVSGLGAEDDNTKDTGYDELDTISSSSGNYYKKLASAHVAQKSGKTATTTLALSY